MKYKSTRGKVSGVSFKDAVMMGLAEDGGLLIPEEIPKLTSNDLERLSNLNYSNLAFEILSYYIDDIPKDDLRKLIESSYKVFRDSEVIPLKHFDNYHIAEIFHGPTFAFKDIALQFLGNLFEYILTERNDKLNIIGATSGDTGSAAIHGVKGRKNINICILHPKGRVSPVQELQMTTVEEENVFNLAIKGNFDDCQAIVKSIFNDLDIKKELKLGAVNSINWARVLAQIVYYFHSYFKVTKISSNPVNIVVPTGNFGNIFAGWIAKQMGLPIKKLILATNENNILTRFIKNGDYSLKEVVQTYSPSMDIQLASNFERYLYYLLGESSENVVNLMEELKNTGKIDFSESLIEKVQEEFDTFSTSNENTVNVIRSFYETYEYILDPHTACGVFAAEHFKNLYSDYEFICLSTAHPAKFGDVVEKAIGRPPEIPDAIKELFNKEKRMTVLENDTEKVKDFLFKNFK